MLTPTRTRVAMVCLLTAAAFAVTGFGQRALAQSPSTPISVTPGGRGDLVNVVVTSPGGNGSGGASSDRVVSVGVDPCTVDLSSAGCSVSNAWAACRAARPQLWTQVGCPVTPSAAAPTPGQLALQAYGLLRLPSPTGDRSPDQNVRWRGYAFSYVNLWTWFWTSPATYRPVSKTVTARGVSATVTAGPTALVFDPGDGGSPVSCAGPGRPWREPDGAGPPATGCGYQYRHVTGAGPITATVSIYWRVTWVGNNGESGALPVLVTQRSAQLNVLQVQVVNTAEARA
jgi:hypothetical protein